MKKKISQKERLRRQAQADKANGVRYFFDEEGHLMKIGPRKKINGVKASTIRPVKIESPEDIPLASVTPTDGSDQIPDVEVKEGQAYSSGEFIQMEEKTIPGRIYK